MPIPAQKTGAIAELLDDIRQGAADRDREHRLPVDEIHALRDLGVTAARVPEELGGWGLTLPELFDLALDIGAADSNVLQALRGHFGYVERLLVIGDERSWAGLREVAGGLLVGNSQAEKRDSSNIGTELTRDEQGWVLDGRKFYSTGTLFSDATWGNAIHDGHRYGVLVPTDAPGVSVIDDWDGFGQRLTGSGTTVFDHVRLTDDQVFDQTEEPDFYLIDNRVFLHLIQLAALAGVGRAAVTDITEYVRGRTRSFGVAGRSEPARDDRVQIVLGGVASRVYGAEALVRDVARVFQRLRETDFADEQQRLDAYVRLQIHQFEAQQVIVDDIVHVTSDVFEVGGASAVSTKRGLDRHWRNARTLGSHNPAIFRRAYIGDWLLNGTQPETFFL